MTAATATDVCTGPCAYEGQHLLGVDLCSYEPTGVVKPGCAREIAFEGPAQALRATGFGCVLRDKEAGTSRTLWQRGHTVVTLLVRDGWTATVRTSAGRTYEITNLTDLVERIAR